MWKRGNKKKKEMNGCSALPASTYQPCAPRVQYYYYTSLQLGRDHCQLASSPGLAFPCSRAHYDNPTTNYISHTTYFIPTCSRCLRAEINDCFVILVSVGLCAGTCLVLVSAGKCRYRAHACLSTLLCRLLHGVSLAQRHHALI